MVQVGKFTQLTSYWPVADGRWRTDGQLIFSSARSGDMVVPPGFTCDLTSIPWIGQPLIEKSGLHLHAGGLHDWLYKNRGVIPGHTKIPLTRDECDLIFCEALTSLGLEDWKVKAMYQAVSLFGKSSWGSE